MPTVDGLYVKIEEAFRTQQTVTLRSLTDFDWDGVYCFYEGVSYDRVNAAVGGKALEPGEPGVMNGALAVFVQDGKPIRKAFIPELEFDAKRYSPDVLVVRGSDLAEPSEVTD